MERNYYSSLSMEVERRAQFRAPEKSIEVRLPFVDVSFLWMGGRQYLSMHTDMMGCFCRTIAKLKSDVRDNLLIQARALTYSQWDELTDHPAYNFFFQRRLFRSKMAERKDAISYLVPKNLNLTREQLKEYMKLDFGPKTLSKEIGFKVGWFPANYLASLAEKETSFNSLAPFLGAVNQFRIGSDTLTGGTLKKAAIRFALEFEDDEVVARSMLDNVSEKAISASSQILSWRYRDDE